MNGNFWSVLHFYDLSGFGGEIQKMKAQNRGITAVMISGVGEGSVEENSKWHDMQKGCWQNVTQ